jgi:hypothetical protein
MQGRYVHTSKEPSCWHVIEAFARRSPRAEWHSSRGRHGRAPASQWAARAKRASSRPCTLGRRSDSRCSCLLLLPLAAAPGRVAPPPSSALLNGRVLYSLLAATGGSVSRTASLLSPSTLPLIPTEPPPSPAATRHIRARWTRDRDGDPHRPTTTTTSQPPRRVTTSSIRRTCFDILAITIHLHPALFPVLSASHSLCRGTKASSELLCHLRRACIPLHFGTPDH